MELFTKFIGLALMLGGIAFLSSNANLEKANLKDANLNGTILKDAKLSGAIMPDGTAHE
ncbi:pentapeptide repeat-containing protein [Microcoleus sp. AS-A8]